MNYVMHAEPGVFRIQGSDVNLTTNQISEAVNIETRIPRDAKTAVRDFIIEVIQNAADSGTEIVINIPQHLSEYSEIIFELIKALIGG